MALPAVDHALLLFLLADMHQDLHDAHAVLDQLVLELVDLVIGALPGGLVAEALDALDQHAAIPGAVEDRPIARAPAAAARSARDSAGPVLRLSARRCARHGSISAPVRRRCARSGRPCRRRPSRRCTGSPAGRSFRWWICRSSSRLCSFFEFVLVGRRRRSGPSIISILSRAGHLPIGSSGRIVPAATDGAMRAARLDSANRDRD